MRSASRDNSSEHRVIDLGGLDLDLGFGAVTVVVRRHPRTRHVRLHVDEAGIVTASIPKRYRIERLDEVVRERAEWLHEVLARMDLTVRTTEVDIERGDPIRLLGRWHPVDLRIGRARGELIDGRLVLHVPASGDPYDALHRWYRGEARQVICERVEWWSTQLGVRHGAISIRDQRTRWGSCTHRADLSFNYRLVMAPLWVLDAIVVHELCHIDELNHSSRFWGLLDQRYPQHVEASEWLRLHGGALRMTRPRPRMPDDDLPPVRPRRGRKVSADNLSML